MKTLPVVVLGIALLLMVTGCASTHRVYPFTADNKAILENKEGITYALPYTVLAVSTDVILIKTAKAEFTKSQYDRPTVEAAAKELGVVLQNEEDGDTAFELGKPAVTSYVEQDPNRQYLVEFGKGPLRSTQLTLVLNKLGCITAGTSAAQDRSIEFAVNTVKGVLQLGATLATLGGGKGSHPSDPVGKCVEAVNQIRSQRLTLLGAGNKGDAAALDAALKKLDQMEASLLWNFTGKPNEDKITVVFEIREDCCPKEGEKTAVLFEFSEVTGFKSIATPVVPVPPDFCRPVPPAATKVTVNKYSVKLSLQPKNQTASLLQGGNIQLTKNFDSQDRRSFRYRIPAQVWCDLLKDNVMSSRANLQLAQWGVVASMPVRAISKDLKYDLKWDENTGGLTSATVETVAENPEHINTVAGAANSYLQANDEKARLQREYDIKDLKNKIRDLDQAELNKLLSAITAASQEK